MHSIVISKFFEVVGKPGLGDADISRYLPLPVCTVTTSTVISQDISRYFPLPSMNCHNLSYSISGYLGILPTISLSKKILMLGNSDAQLHYFSCTFM